MSRIDYQPYLLINGLPPLPPPKSQEEFAERFEIYKSGVELRKGIFLRGTFHGYFLSRIGYYQACRMLFFLVLEHKDLESVGVILKDLFPRLALVFYENEIGFTTVIHEFYLRTLIINLRKLTDSCFYVDLVDEAERILSLIFQIVQKFFKPYYNDNFSHPVYKNHKTDKMYGIKMLRLSFGLRAKIKLSRGDVFGAREDVEKGLLVITHSAVLLKIENEVSAMEKTGFERDSLRFYLAGRKTVFSSSDYAKFAENQRKNFPEGKLYNVVEMDFTNFNITIYREKNSFFDDFEEERIGYFLEHYSNFKIIGLKGHDFNKFQKWGLTVPKILFMV